MPRRLYLTLAYILIIITAAYIVVFTRAEQTPSSPQTLKLGAATVHILKVGGTCLYLAEYSVSVAGTLGSIATAPARDGGCR